MGKVNSLEGYWNGAGGRGAERRPPESSKEMTSTLDGCLNVGAPVFASFPGA